MTLWIFIAVSILLLGGTLRLRLEFGQRQRQLQAELHRLRSRIEGHTQRTETIRNLTADLEAETKTLAARRDELKAKVLEDRVKLTGLEERLERVRPKSHRIENNPHDDKGDR